MPARARADRRRQRRDRQARPRQTPGKPAERPRRRPSGADRHAAAARRQTPPPPGHRRTAPTTGAAAPAQRPPRPPRARPAPRRPRRRPTTGDWLASCPPAVRKAISQRKVLRPASGTPSRPTTAPSRRDAQGRPLRQAASSSRPRRSATSPRYRPHHPRRRRRAVARPSWSSTATSRPRRWSATSTRDTIDQAVVDSLRDSGGLFTDPYLRDGRHASARCSARAAAPGARTPPQAPTLGRAPRYDRRARPHLRGIKAPASCEASSPPPSPKLVRHAASATSLARRLATGTASRDAGRAAASRRREAAAGWPSGFNKACGAPRPDLLRLAAAAPRLGARGAPSASPSTSTVPRGAVGCAPDAFDGAAGGAACGDLIRVVAARRGRPRGAARASRPRAAAR